MCRDAQQRALPLRDNQFLPLRERPHDVIAHTVAKHLIQPRDLIAHLGRRVLAFHAFKAETLVVIDQIGFGEQIQRTRRVFH